MFTICDWFRTFAFRLHQSTFIRSATRRNSASVTDVVRDAIHCCNCDSFLFMFVQFIHLAVTRACYPEPNGEWLRSSDRIEHIPKSLYLFSARCTWKLLVRFRTIHFSLASLSFSLTLISSVSLTLHFIWYFMNVRIRFFFWLYNFVAGALQLMCESTAPHTLATMDG